MDVPFTDHSHIIGRGGKNTQDVMKQTACHIHFPDSNKNHDSDKSNQVSIAGPMGQVEVARSRIRVSLSPMCLLDFVALFMWTAKNTTRALL